MSDCCSPANSLDKARALFAAYGKRRPRRADHPTEEPGAGEVAQGPGNAERLCGRVSTALQIAAYTNV